MKRALISVTDKSGVVDFSQKLTELGYEIISTGGTLKILEESGVNPCPIDEYTGYPEILDGRVKTLHPKVHGGLLYKRDDESHVSKVNELGIESIDLVVVNLYNFEGMLKEKKDHDTMIENIDIGGPSMLRSAAKNYKDVVVVVDPKDYDEVIERLSKDTMDLEYREYLAMKVFSTTAYYDSMIARYFMKHTEKSGNYFTLGMENLEELRYGENPHQSARVYRDNFVESYFSDFEQLQGKELSYNNLNDLNTAVELCAEFDESKGEVVAVGLKHATPCGVAMGSSVYEAYKKAYESDPLSIFGGIVAINGVIDENTAKLMSEIFLEVVAATDYTDEALAILGEKKNLRLLKVDFKKEKSDMDIKYVSGKVLIQDTDKGAEEKFETVTEKTPEDKEVEDLLFGMKVCKYVKSNAVVVVKDKVTLGIGGGQTSRIWALNSIVNNQEGKDFTGSVLASDAFFPFSDCVEVASKMGVKSIIQPGGSIRDKDSIDMCNEKGMSMVFTGVRHFKH